MEDVGTRFAEKIVFTAQVLANAVPGTVNDTPPIGVMFPSCTILPVVGFTRSFPSVSRTACMDPGAFGHTGAAAATRNWWLRNDPPKAAWKKLSARVYF